MSKTSFFDTKYLILLGIIVLVLFLPPLEFGLSTVFLKLKRNEDVKVFEFVSIAINNFSRAWKITGRTILKLLITIILNMTFYAITIVIGFFFMATMFQQNEMLFIFAYILAIVVMILGGVLYIYLISKILLYSLTPYIAYDNKEKTALEVVDESAKLMKGNRMKLFLLYIVSSIVLSLTLGFGGILIFPYIQVATICLYDKSIQPKINEEAPAQESPIQDM